jgi:septal ring factor EnvC (AmiA/AmiB activator)
LSASQQALRHIEQHLRAAYEMGRISYWQLLLNQQEPEQLSRLLYYHEKVVYARRDQFRQHKNSIDQLQQVERDIQAVVLSLQNRQRELQQQHERLVQQRQARERTLARLRGVIKNKDQQLKQQQQQQKELEQIIAAASRIASGKGFASNHVPFQQRKGKLSWPLPGKIQNRFGSVRNGAVRWDGILIKSPAGTAVKVVHSGRVLFADWLPGQGLLMIVDHGDQYMSLYAHNEVLLKEPGEWVESGDTIARSGDSGGQQTAGLYFEIRHKGTPADPAVWFKRG